MWERRCLLLALYGLLLATAVAGALRATRPKFKIATTSTTTSTTEEPDVAANEDSESTTTSSDVNATTARVLTGIPQIDYIWDPNLPRELNGFNLSDYPFYSGIPPAEEIDFKCDGLHDGFYASVAHKCQVYHHCLYGTRYDFLCANFTAFDQKTFICHFASEVDCANSKKYWHRNDALYKAAETTTVPTTTTTSTTTSTTAQPHVAGPRPGSRRRRPFRRRPAYDYYDEEYYDDDVGYERSRPRGYDRRDDYDYEDRKYTRRDRERVRDFRDRDYRDRDLPRGREPDRPLRESDRPPKDDREPAPLSPRERFPSRNTRRDPVRPSAAIPRDPPVDEEPRNRNREHDSPMRPRKPDDAGDDRKIPDTRNREVDDRRYSDKGSMRDDYDDEPAPSGSRSSTGTTDMLVKPAAPPSSVYARPRAPPKIRRPVPVSEQDKFAYKAASVPPTAAGEARRRPVEVAAEDDYYDDELEEVRPRRPMTRRRPGFRDFYENPRDRDRDRPYRPRYREDDEEMIRPRKHPERNRERYYERGPERGRDRSLDRSKDRMPESPRRPSEADRPERPIGGSHNREADRPIGGSNNREADRPIGGSNNREADRPITGSHNREAERPIGGSNNREADRPITGSHNREAERPISGSHNREVERPITGSNNREVERPRIVETPNTRRPNLYERTSVAPPTTTTSTTTTEAPKEEPADRPFRTQNFQNPSPRNHPKAEAQNPRPTPVPPRGHLPEHEDREVQEPVRQEIPLHRDDERKEIDAPRGHQEEYSSSEDYYDEPEYAPAPPPPPPRTAVRVVKRPFLPSRGGNPNPRGLSPVGVRAMSTARREEPKSNRSGPVQIGPNQSDARGNDKDDRKTSFEVDKRPYDAYKYVQTDENPKPRPDEFEGVLTRPSIGNPENDREDRSRDDDPRNPIRGRNEDSEDEKSVTLKWNSDEFRLGNRGDVRHDGETSQGNNGGSQNRSKARPPIENTDYYANENTDQPTSPAGSNKQIINEVVTHHRLQDIPESEYDVTLNDALTPSFGNQDANLPSGFVLPIHRQLGRGDPILESTENSYKVSRPYNQQNQGQQQQQQQQKAFMPSPQFLPLTAIGSNNGNERSRSVQYFRTPEAVHVTGTQYRHHRGPWHDYTGY